MCLCSTHGVLQLKVPICFNLSASPLCFPVISTCETWPLRESARICPHVALSRRPASPPTHVSRQLSASLLPCVLCCFLDVGFSGTGSAPDECLTPDRTQHFTVFSSVRQKERDLCQRHMGSEEPTPAKRASAHGHRCGSKLEPPLRTWTHLQEREGLEGACCCPLRTRPRPSSRTHCPGSTCLTEETTCLQTTRRPAPRGARCPSEGRAPAEAPSGWPTRGWEP